MKSFKQFVEATEYPDEVVNELVKKTTEMIYKEIMRYHDHFPSVYVSYELITSTIFPYYTIYFTVIGEVWKKPAVEIQATDQNYIRIIYSFTDLVGPRFRREMSVELMEHLYMFLKSKGVSSLDVENNEAVAKFPFDQAYKLFKDDFDVQAGLF